MKHKLGLIRNFVINCIFIQLFVPGIQCIIPKEESRINWMPFERMGLINTNSKEFVSIFLIVVLLKDPESIPIVVELGF